MDISEYRARFASFNSSLELVRFNACVGLKSELTLDEAYDRYSDLFSGEAIAELKSLKEQIPASQETQRTGLAKLITAASLRYAEIQSTEISRELEHCESATALQWRSETLALNDVPERIAREPDKDMRRDLSDRWLDALLECNDLREARLASLNESAKSVGSQSFSALAQEPGGAKPEVSTLLKETESSYNEALNRLLAREFTNLSQDELLGADLFHIETLPWLDQYYQPRDFYRVQAEMMSGLGIRPDQQREIRIDSEVRPLRKRGAACFPIAPPYDVRVAMQPLAGAASFLNSLDCAGKAQHYAWCSPDLTSRNPEFVYSADSATSRAYGYLFLYLPIEARWNLDFLISIDEGKASRIGRAVAFHLALCARRLSAEAWYENNVLSETRGLEDLTAAYERSFKEATSFRSRLEFFLAGLQNDETPLAKLRALAFSFVLREYMRMRFGHRWWTSRKAGDELVDLWSTSSRYSVEELSSLLGFGQLSFDLLAEVINVGLTGD